MLFNARALALFCALLISSSTTFLLSMLSDTGKSGLATAGFITFLLTYLMIWIIVQFLFYREIEKINVLLKKNWDKELPQSSPSTPYLNPIEVINRRIKNYTSSTTQEIAKLKEMEAFRREFIADISHELKTPIFSAQGFIHTLMDGAVEEEKVRMKFLKKAAKSLDGLDSLVQDLLAISQIESGHTQMKKENFDVVQMVKELVDQNEEKFEKNNLKPEFGFTVNEIIVFADPKRIRQVLVNLITNAINYSKKGAKIGIDIKLKKKYAKISIKDSGLGIPPEDINRIFERFYRVEKSRSKDMGGTGLGLAIVKHILESHNSEIKVESKLGSGSKFWFQLELAPASKKS